MAFCPNCGAQVSGTFCPNCGANVAAAQNAGTASAPGAGAAGAGAASGAAYVPPAPPPIQAAGMSENVAGALCYLAGFVTGIIFLVMAPYNTNKFIRFHAFQSIFASIALVVIGIAFGIFTVILGVLTHGLGWILYPLYDLLIFLVWIYLMYSAYNSRKVKLPVIGDLAERQA